MQVPLSVAPVGRAYQEFSISFAWDRLNVKHFRDTSSVDSKRSIYHVISLGFSSSSGFLTGVALWCGKKGGQSGSGAPMLQLIFLPILYFATGPIHFEGSTSQCFRSFFDHLWLLSPSQGFRFYCIRLCRYGQSHIHGVIAQSYDTMSLFTNILLRIAWPNTIVYASLGNTILTPNYIQFSTFSITIRYQHNMSIHSPAVLNTSFAFAYLRSL